MRQLLAHILRYRIYYALCILFIMIGLLSLLNFAKGEVVLIFNRNQSPALNSFFMFATTLGEALGGMIVFLILLLTSKFKHATIFVVAVLITTFASSGLKRGVFSDEKRPSHMFSDLNHIENLERHTNFSFPSGHTTAGFTFYTVLCFALRKRWIQVVSFTCAALVGISRVYLAQHFVNDVVAGAVLGLFLTTCCYILLHDRLSKIPFFERKLFAKA